MTPSDSWPLYLLAFVPIDEDTAVRVQNDLAKTVDVVGQGGPVWPFLVDDDMEQPVASIGRQMAAAGEQLPIPCLAAHWPTGHFTGQRVETGGGDMEENPIQFDLGQTTGGFGRFPNQAVGVQPSFINTRERHDTPGRVRLTAIWYRAGW